MRKKAFEKFGISSWCTKKPFGYQVVHQCFYNLLRANKNIFFI